MSLLKVAILLAVTLAVTSALAPTRAIQDMAKKAFWDPSANADAPGKPPYSFCGAKLASGSIVVKSYDMSMTSPGGPVTYTLTVDLKYPKSGSSAAFTQSNQVVRIRKASNGKLSVISNPCG